MSPKIEIKGIREGLLVTVGSGEWPETRRILLSNIKAKSEFLEGAQLTLDVGNRILRVAELSSLRDDLSDHKVTLRAVISHSPTTEQAAQNLGLATRLSKPHPDRSTRPLDTTVGGEEALLVHRTLRSGHSITYEGHVIVIGDVNPGAQIIAGGNIIVWGRLRGTVHAGASGEEKAIVCALELTPTQLRIAENISIAPTQKETPQPEIARLKGRQVVAEPWNTPKSSIINNH